ncbi:hypothetical protein T265_08566 [Opisthorchis viverrini]|uniref:Uncharacterized protein n=1 Tax=Opisthorchis viverrini TaxID=6198 RepID=A0A075A7X9_OPIVI|nr:hypothetical protein T265_08566 [Opisthorchis viverrini]KER23574.1 hypothetical protein T265_08566 [Opisthorchis viverrini]
MRPVTSDVHFLLEGYDASDGVVEDENDTPTNFSTKSTSRVGDLPSGPGYWCVKAKVRMVYKLVPGYKWSFLACSVCGPGAHAMWNAASTVLTTIRPIFLSGVPHKVDCCQILTNQNRDDAASRVIAATSEAMADEVQSRMCANNFQMTSIKTNRNKMTTDEGGFQSTHICKEVNILTLKFLFRPQGFCRKIHCASSRWRRDQEISVTLMIDQLARVVDRKRQPGRLKTNTVFIGVKRGSCSPRSSATFPSKEDGIQSFSPGCYPHLIQQDHQPDEF